MKDYEEIEVWVDIDELDQQVFYGYDPKVIDTKSKCVKATLKIPKPERKVEITRSQCEDILNGLYKIDQFTIAGVLDEIFRSEK